jgi:hypothetical protein
MRITSLHAALPLLLLPVLQAQNPPAPAAITPRLDSPQARVIVATLQPRTPSIARTGHATDRVLVYLDDGAMTRKEGEQSPRSNFTAGMSAGGRRVDHTSRKTSATMRSAFSRLI